ncbi:DUF4870 family protein [Oceanomicrobium pacificus]|uniref:DUF4870 domain-containing protein n=1 Tax=Oceanomicrobium pacificus TaxID=2692916 RepID=A0A6B0TK23_9RHOB|nr:DUF4870 domain-containing protein [Oceanomicrobium pacificus]MXU64206.1 hypothetical protein [Oceanomicrobium pacificus]
MTDPTPTPPASAPDGGDWFDATPNNAKLNYILYLVSFILGFTGLVALVFAYLNRKKAPEWLQSHYTYQIRTFWIMLLYTLISIILALVVIGMFLLVGVSIWFIVRCVKGLQAVGRGEPLPNAKTWWI